MRKNKAFTLIELLVVIAIIGLLAGAVSVAFSQARKKSRDTRRKSDINALRQALDLHYVSNSKYTAPEDIWADTSVGCNDPVPVCANRDYPDGTDWDPGSDLRDLEKDGSIQKLPIDPMNKTPYFYRYEVEGSESAYQRFRLCANKMETESGFWCNDTYGKGLRSSF